MADFPKTLGFSEEVTIRGGLELPIIVARIGPLLAYLSQERDGAVCGVVESSCPLERVTLDTLKPPRVFRVELSDPHILVVRALLLEFLAEAYPSTHKELTHAKN